MTDSETSERPKKKVLIIVFATVIVALLVAAVAYFACPTDNNGDSDQQKPPVSTTTSADSSSDGNDDVTDPATPAPIGGKIVLPKAMSGQEAIDALGASIGHVAEQNNLTVEEFKELLLRDASAHVSRTGRLLYLDSGLNQAAER